MKVNIECILWHTVKRDCGRSPSRVAGALDLYRLQIWMHDDQRVSRLRPAHIVNNARANGSG